MIVSHAGRSSRRSPGRWSARVTVLGLVGAAALTALGCGSAPAAPSATEASPVTTAPIQAQPVLDAEGRPEGIHNYKKWSDRIGQGAQPEGEVAFRNLAALGYTTLISVDGARPDAETAAKYGLTYVHIPFGYNAVPKDAQARIVKAVETSPGPVFVHCHHGQHRGPAGVMIARIAVDGISNEEAIVELKASGCSENYKGLYRDVMACVPPTAAELAEVPAKQPAYVSPGDVAEHMAVMDRVWERVGFVKDAKWTTPPSMPDVDPPHEARIVWEAFREMARLDESKKHGAEFMAILDRAEQGSKALEEAIRKGDAAAAAKSYDAVKSSCTDCHKKWRNN
jgi:protein tyrosine phosphatase (PTP) superfamily phosphohydrolase (DUF442 family)